MKTTIKISAILMMMAAIATGCFKSEEPFEDGTIVTSGIYEGHGYVDLGLPSGTLWSTCNIGATTPEGCGDYFAWGEVSPKSFYDLKNNKYYKGDVLNKYSKYTNDDKKTTLDLEDDPAAWNWGGSWRVPTKEQCEELLSNTKSRWTTVEGVQGRLFTASNGNALFLPAMGHMYESSPVNSGKDGEYLSSSRYPNVENNFLYLDLGAYSARIGEYGSRGYGFTVRPVCPAQ